MSTHNYDHSDNPILPIIITLNRRHYSFKSYLDTGFDGGISLTKNDVKKIGMFDLGSPKSTSTHWLLANGYEIKADQYFITVKIENNEFPSTLIITESDYPTSSSDEVVGLLGRDILDNYKTIFDGLSVPKSFSLQR